MTLADLQDLDDFTEHCPEVPLDEIVERVAMKQVVVIAGETVTDRTGKAVVAVPVADLPVLMLTFAWQEGTKSPALSSLVREARRVTALERQRRAS